MATKNGQVYHSTNRGVRWTPLPFSLNGNAALHAIVVHPNTSNVLYLGVAENSAQPLNSGISGVFKSDDAGQTWTLLPATRDWPVLSLAIHPKQSQIIVAGTLQGVYRSENAGTDWKRISPQTIQTSRASSRSLWIQQMSKWSMPAHLICRGVPRMAELHGLRFTRE